MKLEKKDKNKCVGGKLTLITIHYQEIFNKWNSSFEMITLNLTGLDCYSEFS